jgi:hypothetical protein
MVYDTKLADKIREHLAAIPKIKIEEKKTFRRITFMINGKMCINVSGDNLMCRFDPELEDKISEKKGFEPMIMRGKQLKGYCYVNPIGFKARKDFEYWIDLCLEYNKKAKSSKRKASK